MLYQVVQENLNTLYAAVEDGFAHAPLPPFVRRELQGFLDCGQLVRGFGVAQCDRCRERRLVALSCKGRGFCPSCAGRRMVQVASNLTDHVLPPVALRQWVFTLPHALRARLSYDGPLLGAVGRIFVDTVQGFYRRRMRDRRVGDGQGGAVTVVQRVQGDLRLSPHFHTVALDGVFVAAEGSQAPCFHQLPHLGTSDVADVLQVARVRVLRFLLRRGVVQSGPEVTLLPDDLAAREPALAQLAASSVSGLPPAGPEVRRKPVMVRLPGRAGVSVSGPLCCDEAGFGLHAATIAGAQDAGARMRLLRYVLRPPIAQDRISRGPEELVRVTLRKPFKDGTTAIDLDPLSLLCRLAASVPPPRFNTLRYSGVLAAHAKLRPLVVPPPPASPDPAAPPAAAPSPDKKPAAPNQPPRPPTHRSRYRPWLELLQKTFGSDLADCACGGRMKFRSFVRDPSSIERYLLRLGEPTSAPPLAPARAPPYWKSTALRRRYGPEPASRDDATPFFDL